MYDIGDGYPESYKKYILILKKLNVKKELD